MEKRKKERKEEKGRLKGFYFVFSRRVVWCSAVLQVHSGGQPCLE